MSVRDEYWNQIGHARFEPFEPAVMESGEPHPFSSPLRAWRGEEGMDKNRTDELISQGVDDVRKKRLRIPQNTVN
jgi:hypothetical protein